MRVVYSLAIVSLFLSLLIIFTLPSQSQTDYRTFRLFIFVNGNEVPVPPGLNGQFKTYEEAGLVFMKSPGTLGDFFDEWGVVFNNKCLFQYCQEDLRMYVNERENFDYNEYRINSGDQIILIVKTF